MISAARGPFRSSSRSVSSRHSAREAPRSIDHAARRGHDRRSRLRRRAAKRCAAIARITFRSRIARGASTRCMNAESPMFLHQTAASIVPESRPRGVLSHRRRSGLGTRDCKNRLRPWHPSREPWCVTAASDAACARSTPGCEGRRGFALTPTSSGPLYRPAGDVAHVRSSRYHRPITNFAR